MMTTSFFSQSWCSSVAVILRALSGGGVDGGAGVWLGGFFDSRVSFELQAARPAMIAPPSSIITSQRIGPVCFIIPRIPCCRSDGKRLFASSLHLDEFAFAMIKSRPGGGLTYEN